MLRAQSRRVVVGEGTGWHPARDHRGSARQAKGLGLDHVSLGGPTFFTSPRPWKVMLLSWGGPGLLPSAHRLATETRRRDEQGHMPGG